MDTPELSIILPVYNGEAFLGQAVESVQNSTLQDWELILVNDGSLDATETLCKEFCLEDKRIHLISQDNRGLSAARNAGFSIARGTYVMYLDADDYVEPDYYEKVLGAAKATKADFLVTGFTREFLHERRKKRIVPYLCPWRFLQSIEEIQQASQEPFFYNVYIHAWNKVYRRERLQQHQILFDENFRYGEDVPYNIRVLETSKTILFLDCAGYHYICRDRARLTTKWNPDLPDYNRIIFNKIHLHEKQNWNIENSALAAGSYLRSCFLTWEKAYKGHLPISEILKLIQQMILYFETQQAIQILSERARNIEFRIYYNLIRGGNPYFIYAAVLNRNLLKRLLGR